MNERREWKKIAIPKKDKRGLKKKIGNAEKKKIDIS